MSEELETAYDVMIVGAGMVGATLGCALGQKGMKVMILDHSSPKPFAKTQGPDLRVSALNMASANILQHLHVWPQVKKMRFCPFETMQIWEELEEIMPILQTVPFLSKGQEPINKTVFKCSDINLPALGYIIENRILQCALHDVIDTLDNVTLLAQARIKDFPLSPEESDKKVVLEDGRCFSSPLIVGADGASSMVRSWATMGVNRREYEQKALVALAEVEQGPLDTTWQAFVKTGPMALLPMPDCNGKHYVSIVWYHQPDEVDRLMDLSDPAFISELSHEFPDSLPEVLGIVERNTFPLAKQHAQKYVLDGIALVGDAAHTINPLAGQGVNLGLMDVAELVDVIMNAREKHQPYWEKKTLEVYEEKRYKANRNMGWILDGFHYGFSNDIMPVKLLRNAGLALADKLGPVTRYIEGYGAGLKGKLPSLAMPFEEN